MKRLQADKSDRDAGQREELGEGICRQGGGKIGNHMGCIPVKGAGYRLIVTV